MLRGKNKQSSHLATPQKFQLQKVPTMLVHTEAKGSQRADEIIWSFPASKIHSHQPPAGCVPCIGSPVFSRKFLSLLWRCSIPWASLKNKYIKLSLIKSPITNWMKIIAINMTKG